MRARVDQMGQEYTRLFNITRKHGLFQGVRGILMNSLKKSM
jgi:hypothetical protein